MTILAKLRTKFHGVLNYCGKTIERYRGVYTVYSIGGDAVMATPDDVYAFLMGRETPAQVESRLALTAKKFGPKVRKPRTRKIPPMTAAVSL